jgi:hypothetical protein
MVHHSSSLKGHGDSMDTAADTMIGIERYSTSLGPVIPSSWLGTGGFVSLVVVLLALEGAVLDFLTDGTALWQRDKEGKKGILINEYCILVGLRSYKCTYVGTKGIHYSKLPWVSLGWHILHKPWSRPLFQCGDHEVLLSPSSARSSPPP